MKEPRQLKFGRIPSPASERIRNFHLLDYLEKLPTAPSSYDASSGVSVWPMDGNDRFGCCVVAGAAHLIEVWTAEVDGKPRLVPEQEVIDTYFRLTGGPDSGLDMLSTLNIWRKQGLLEDKVLGFAEVTASNHAEVKAAAWLFNGLYIGFPVPGSAMQQFHRNQPWDLVPDDGGIVGGHCVDVVGYDDHGLTVVTWGQLQKMSWSFWDRYVGDPQGEVYALVPEDLNRLSGRPLLNGFNEAQLLTDLQQLHNPVGPPPPAPNPGPNPPPPPPGVLAWLRALLDWLEHLFGK